MTTPLQGVVTPSQFGLHVIKEYHQRGDVSVIVAPTGGDYSSLNTALSAIVDASPTKKYDILVKPGTYAETIVTKDYVNLIGDNPATCIINYVAPDPANWVNTSTIFATSNSVIENLAIKATNSKYPIHSDAGGTNTPWKLKIENCILQHLGSTDSSMTSGTPFGIGLYQGQHVEIKDSTLKGFNVANDVGCSGVYVHNQLSSVGIGYRSLRVENCDIQNVAYGINVGGLAGTSDQDNDVFIIGNRIHAYMGDIYVGGAPADLGFNIKGYGNNLKKVYQPSNDYIVEQPGYTLRIRNVSALIPKGAVVTIFAAYQGLGAVNGWGSNNELVLGVAMQDIATNTEGVIQISGYVKYLKVNGATPIVVGDLLSTYSASGIACKGTTNTFAIAMGAYSVADSNGLIPAIITKSIYK